MKVPTRILRLLRIRMLSTSRRLLTKVYYPFTALFTTLIVISFSIPIKDQLLKARTSIVKRVRSVGKSSKPKPPQSPRSHSHSPHPPPLAALPPSTAALSPPIPTSPFDFSSQPLSSATTPRNLHYPSSSASDSDAFGQSETTYKGSFYSSTA